MYLIIIHTNAFFPLLPQQISQFPRTDIQFGARKDSFTCPKCGKAYAHRASLSRHVHHECGKEPSFQCPYCPKRFKQKQTMKQHIGIVHMELLRPRQLGHF